MKLERPEERLTSSAVETVRGLSSEGRRRVEFLVERIRNNPEVDDRDIYDVPTKTVSFRVLVDPEYKIFFRLEGNIVRIYTISPTSDSLRRALAKA